MLANTAVISTAVSSATGLDDLSAAQALTTD
jgi:hypothetical protein